jgi:uncharacterized protein
VQGVIGLPQPGGRLPRPHHPGERWWAVLAHLTLFLLPLIGPLAVRVGVGDDRPFARANATEALNFHLTLFVAVVLSVVVGQVADASAGVAMLVITVLFGMATTMLAAVAAARTLGFRYPLSWRPVS